jgi:hypothetical protein
MPSQQPKPDCAVNPEDQWPVHCRCCGYSLKGLGAEGCCPECGEAFDRRYRLWEQHGPDVLDLEGGPPPPNPLSPRLLLQAPLFVALVLGSFLLVCAGCYLLLGRIDFISIIVTWLLVDSLAVWILRKVRLPGRLGPVTRGRSSNQPGDGDGHQARDALPPDAQSARRSDETGA